MGNEYASHGSQLGIGKQTLTSAQEYEMCIPGKSTLAEAEMSSVEGDVARVARRAGERIVDRAQFDYLVLADGSFQVVNAPAPFNKKELNVIGRRITVGE